MVRKCYYPLVSQHSYWKVMNIAIYSGFKHETWWFSEVMLVYQRVNVGKCRSNILVAYAEEHLRESPNKLLGLALGLWIAFVGKIWISGSSRRFLHESTLGSLQAVFPSEWTDPWNRHTVPTEFLCKPQTYAEKQSYCKKATCTVLCFGGGTTR